MLTQLKRILLDEKRMVLKDVLRQVYPAYVLDSSEHIATLECRYANLFESGDVLGLVVSKERMLTASQLGTVIDSSDELLTVFTNLQLNEGWDLRLVNYEPLIAFDLQLKLIEKIEREENRAANLFF